MDEKYKMPVFHSKGQMMKPISDKRLAEILQRTLDPEKRELAIEIQAAYETITRLSAPVSEKEWHYSYDFNVARGSGNEGHMRCYAIILDRLNAPADGDGGAE